jgi:TonB family protein
MKTRVFRVTSIVALVLLLPLTLNLAQSDYRLAQQSVDFVASDLLVTDDIMPLANPAMYGKNTFKNVETYPVPENGVELGTAVNGLITYPKSAIDQGIEGVVKVLCMVAKDGSVSSVVVLQDIGGNCAEEVCKAVKTIRFKPAMQNGYPRRCNLVIPVVFDLTDYQ